MSPASSSDRGSVLVVVVLLSLGMFTVAHGLLLTARATLTTAHLGARLAEAAAVSDGAVAAFVRRGPLPEAGLVQVGGSWSVFDSVGSVPIEGTWRRLDRETWIVSAAAPTPAGTMIESGSRLVWWPDPVVRIRALPATVSLGPDAAVGVTGAIRNATLAEERAGASPALAGLCDPIWLEWAAIHADEVGEASGAGLPVPVGSIAAPGLGFLAVDELLRRADSLPADRGSPTPHTLGGSCAVEDPWNWGDPERPAGACGDHWVMMSSKTSLHLDGGVGQGVLVVEGDLLLASDTHLHGVVVATGVVRLVDAATITGVLIAGAGFETSGDAIVVRSACQAVRALAGARAMLGAAPLHSALDFIPR